MMNNPHYLYRMTVLVAVAALAPVVSHDVLCNSMLPVVVAAAKDKARPFADACTLATNLLPMHVRWQPNCRACAGKLAGKQSASRISS